MGRVTVAGGNPGMKAPVTYKANFADNTWAQIIDACHKKQSAGDVGSWEPEIHDD